jgi:NAD+ kinase
MAEKIVGIVAHSGKSGAASLTRALLKDLGEHRIEARLETETAHLLGRSDGCTIPELAEVCEIILVLGGDGSILRVAHSLGEKMCPLLGINLGALGFLTCVNSADHSEVVQTIAAGQVVLSSRALLQVDKLDSAGNVLASFRALNDAVISRGQISRLVKVQVNINGDQLTEYHADGLIVATSTGSTAYSLSAGGPIIVPGSGVFVITPICPHVLTNRSVIVSQASCIEISPCPDNQEVFLTVDGQDQSAVANTDRVRIRAAAQRLSLGLLPGTTFPQVLRQKLRWSGSSIAP